MDTLKKDIKLYSGGMFCLAALDLVAVIFCLAIRGFDIELLTRVMGKGTAVAFAMVVFTIAFNLVCALLKVKLGLKGFSQLKTYTSKSHIKLSVILMILLAIGFALSMVIFASGYYGMITAFTCAFGIYWTLRYRSISKFYLNLKDSENQIDAPIEEVDAEEVDEVESVDFDVEVIDEE